MTTKPLAPATPGPALELGRHRDAGRAVGVAQGSDTAIPCPGDATTFFGKVAITGFGFQNSGSASRADRDRQRRHSSSQRCEA